MANECDVELENVFINYKDKGHRVSLDGVDTVAGKPCYIIKLIRKTVRQKLITSRKRPGELVMKKAVAKNPELGKELVNHFI